MYPRLLKGVKSLVRNLKHRDARKFRLRAKWFIALKRVKEELEKEYGLARDRMACFVGEKGMVVTPKTKRLERDGYVADVTWGERRTLVEGAAESLKEMGKKTWIRCSTRKLDFTKMEFHLTRKEFDRLVMPTPQRTIKVRPTE